MSHSSDSRIVIYAAILGNAGIAVSKFVAAYFTLSSAMVAEGIHSAVDTADGLLMLYGLGQSQKPADELHPFGHGKELYFWTLIVAMMVFGIGGGMSLYQGVMHVLHPQPLESAIWNYWVLGIAAIFEGTSWTLALRAFGKIKRSDRSVWQTIHASKDPTDFIVLLEDSAALVGLAIAFFGVLLGHLLHNPYLDATASMLIGLLLAAVAFVLAYESKGLLLGESADPAMVASIRQLVQADDDVVRVGHPLTMHLAPQHVLLNLDIKFSPGLSSDQLEQVVDRLEAAIRKKHPAVRRIFIEAEAFRATKAD